MSHVPALQKTSFSEPVALTRAIVLIAAFGLPAYNFYHATDDISYDYLAYIRAFLVLSRYTTSDMFSSFAETFPYITIPPSLLFEGGFTFLAWTFLAQGVSAENTFFFLVSVSMAARAVQCWRLDARWFEIILIALTTVTLLEANAIRLGLCATLLIAAMLQLAKRKNLHAFLIGLAACLFHIQGIIFWVSFLAGYAYFSVSDKRMRNALTVLALVVTPTIIPYISSFNVYKLDDYIGRETDAAGLNMLSLATLITLIAGLVPLFKGTVEPHARRVWAVWFGAYFSLWQTTIIAVLVTDIGALSVRIWQLGLFLMAFMTWMVRRQVGVKTVPGFRQFVWLLNITLFLTAVNVVIRYPLSNAFAPFTPYVAAHQPVIN